MQTKIMSAISTNAVHKIGKSVWSPEQFSGKEKKLLSSLSQSLWEPMGASKDMWE